MEVAAVVVEAAAKPKIHVTAAMACTCWAAAVHSSPNMETDVPILVFALPYGGTDCTIVPRHGSARLDWS